MAGNSSVVAPLEELGEAAKVLTDKQKKIDKNHNGKLDADDFARLRKEGIDRVVITSPYTPDIHGGLAEVTHRDLRTGVVTVMFENMYYKLKKGQFKELPENFEQLDELSKATLGSYIKKASNKMAQSHAEVEKARADRNAAHTIDHATTGTPSDVRQKVKDIISNDASKREKTHFKDVVKRHTGIGKAVGKLTKEEAEDLDELSSVTLSSYADKARPQSYTSSGNTIKKRFNRIDGGVLAHAKIKNDNVRVPTKEEVELSQDEIDMIEASLADLEEGRGRPPKEGSEAWKRRQSQAAEDIPALGIQLRKAASINKPVTFANGESKQIHSNHINRFNDHMDARKTSQEKADFQKTANKSHADFVKAVTADIPHRAKDTGEIVKYGK